MEGRGGDGTALEKMKAHSASTMQRLRQASSSPGAPQSTQQAQQSQQATSVHGNPINQSTNAHAAYTASHLREDAEARAAKLVDANPLHQEASPHAQRDFQPTPSSSATSTGDLRHELSSSQKQLAQAQADLRAQVCDLRCLHNDHFSSQISHWLY